MPAFPRQVRFEEDIQPGLDEKSSGAIRVDFQGLTDGPESSPG